MKQCILIAITPLLLIVACATTGPAVGGGAKLGTDVVMDMQPILGFSPTPRTISVVDAVEFRNVTAVVHSVSTRPTRPQEAASAELPVDAEGFDSGGIEIYRQTFTIPSP